MVETASGAPDDEAPKADRPPASNRRLAGVVVAIVVVVAVIIFGGGAYLFTQLFTGHVRQIGQMQTMQLTSSSYAATVDAQGSFQVANGSAVSPEVDGTIADVRVSTGDVVAKGDVLFTIENAQLTQDANTAKTAYDQASAALDTANAALSEANSKLASAQEARDTAKSAAERKAAEETARKQAEEQKSQAEEQQKQQDGKFDSSSSSSSSSGSSASGSNGGTSNASSTKSSKTQTRASFGRGAGIVLASSSSSSASFDSSSYDKEISAAQTEVDKAQAQVDTAKQTADTAQTTYDNAMDKVDKLTVKAPIAGTVVDSKVQKGMTSQAVNSQGAAMQIADLDTMTAVVQVPAAQIATISTGLKATITSSSLPDQKINATVSKVADTPTQSEGSQLSAGRTGSQSGSDASGGSNSSGGNSSNSSGNASNSNGASSSDSSSASGASTDSSSNSSSGSSSSSSGSTASNDSTYEVTLTLEKADNAKVGMSITAAIELKEFSTVYYVPSTAISQNGTYAYVEVVYNDNTTKQHQVQVIDTTDDGQVVIQGGTITEGQRILTDIS